MAGQDGRAAFEKILNFRDVGKYINHLTGQTILKEGLLYRSARPDTATPSDRRGLIEDFEIKTIIDLRTPTEHIEQAQKHASAPIPSAPAISPDDPLQPLRILEIEYKDINFNGSAYSNALMKQLSYFNMAKFLFLYILGYRKEAIGVLAANVMAERGLHGLAMDSLEHCKAEVKDVFSVLSDADSYPLMVHCTQGKDRTGLIVVLVLLLCGVPQGAIRKDYMLSENELQPEREEKLAEIRSIGLPDTFADCPEDWVSKVCDYLDKTFGGGEKYLECCGVMKDQQMSLRELLMASGCKTEQ